MNRSLTLVAMAVAGILYASSANAYDYELGDVDIRFNSTFTAGMAVRAEEPTCDLTGDPTSHACGSSAASGAWASSDNGNLNYDAGDIFSLNIKGLHDLSVELPDDWSIFARGSWIYDIKADDTDRTALSHDAYNAVGRNAQLLDLWIGKSFVLDGHRNRIRLGNQVVNWGESMFYIGGVSTTAAVDYQRLTTPGTQLKEGLLPSPMVNFQTEIGDGWSAEAYYQQGWRRNKYPAVGTFWSTADFLGAGDKDFYTVDTFNLNRVGYDAATILRMQGNSGRLSQSQIDQTYADLAMGAYAADPTIHSYAMPILGDVTPKSGGQYGVAVRWTPDFVVANLGFYYVNYHAKDPVLTSLSAGALQWSFPEDRHMFGVSANFPIGDWAIGTELSYRPNEPVTLSGCYNVGGLSDANTNGATVDCPMWIGKDKYQLNVNGLLNMGGSDYADFLDLFGADSSVVAAEAVAIAYPELSRNGKITRNIDGVDVYQLYSAGYLTWLQYDSTLGYDIAHSVGTPLSVGYTVDFSLTYDGSIIPGWQVIPGITFQHSAYGNTPNVLGTVSQGAMSTNLYVNFAKNSGTWGAGINYAAFFGPVRNRLPAQVLSDRDFVGMYVSYTF